MSEQAAFALTKLLRRLVDGGVDFVVVGGVAVVAQAMPRFTKDLDICYARDSGNLLALTAVLKRLPSLLRLIAQATAQVLQVKPDLLVIIDSPDFTHRVARRVRRRGSRRARSPGGAARRRPQ